MFCMTVSYPRSDKATFDMDYYLNSHLPLVKERFGPLGLVQIVLRTDVARKPGGESQYFASVDLVFDSIESFKKATATHGAEINADIPNYTDAGAEFGFSAFDSTVL